MESRIAEVIGLKTRPVTLLWSDEKPVPAVERSFLESGIWQELARGKKLPGRRGTQLHAPAFKTAGHLLVERFSDRADLCQKTIIRLLPGTTR